MHRANLLLIAATCLAMAFAQDDEAPVDRMMTYSDDPSSTSEGSSGYMTSDSSDPTSIIGVVTLWPKDSLSERPPRPPRPDRCPKWSEWKNVTCWWPSMSFSDLPQECTYMPLPKKVPKDVQDLIRGKAQEAYDAILYEYEQRGKPPKCGYCSRSFKCRSRNMTQDDANLNSMSDFERRHHRRRGGRGRHGRGDQCKPKEIQPVHDECDDHAPCEVTKENGICKTPFFLNPAKIDRIQNLMKQKDHQGAADELFASMNGDESERKKRQAGFNGNDYGSDVYGYGMNPQFDSGFGGDGGRRFRFHGRQQQYGPGSDMENRPFGPRQGSAFGPDSDRPMPPRPYGPWNNDRQGRQGPPLSFGPGDEGQRGPFGPREDERRSPFEPEGRRGRQGPFPAPPPFGGDDGNRWGPEGRRHGPPPPPFGPGGDDDDRRRQGPPPPPPFGPEGDDRRGPFGPGHGRRQGPPPPPFGPRDDDQWGPSRRHGPMPPPFGDDENEWGPFGPPGWGPFGPHNRHGRFGPMPPYGPGGDDRRGRQWPPRPWSPRRHHHRGPWGMGGSSNQENEDINQRQTFSSSNRGGDGEDSRGFVYRLLHETNCVNANDTCLCCCGPYIPNITNSTCDDLRQLFPGIEDTADALMMLGGDRIDDGDQDLQPPVEPPMIELSPSDDLPFEEMPVPQRRNNFDGPSGAIKISKPEHDFK